MHSDVTELERAGRRAAQRAPLSFIKSKVLVRGKLSWHQGPAEPPGTRLHSLGNPIPAAAARQPHYRGFCSGFGYSAGSARLLLAFNFPDITCVLGKCSAVHSGI